MRVFDLTGSPLASAAGAADQSLAAVVKAMRDADRCPSCQKTRAVINVGTKQFRAERISPELHCLCEGSPAWTYVRHKGGIA